MKKEKRNCDGCKLFGNIGVHSFACPIRQKKIKVVLSPRIDYCGACKKDHGYYCPLDFTPTHQEIPEWEAKIEDLMGFEYIEGAYQELPENIIEAKKIIRAEIEAAENRGYENTISGSEIADMGKITFQMGKEEAFLAGQKAIVEAVRENIEKICERHKNWKPTEGYGSEEELGYQKGLQAEAKLLSSDILLSLQTLEDNLK